MGATEDAASRRPARPGGTRLIVKRALARDAHAQRAGHDLEASRRRPDLLAVELDRQTPLGVDGDGTRAQQLDLGVREIRTLVDLRRRGDEVALRDVADQYNVERSVVRARFGREPHRAAVPLPV